MGKIDAKQWSTEEYVIGQCSDFNVLTEVEKNEKYFYLIIKYTIYGDLHDKKGANTGNFGEPSERVA